MSWLSFSTEVSSPTAVMAGLVPAIPIS